MSLLDQAEVPEGFADEMLQLARMRERCRRVSAEWARRRPRYVWNCVINAFISLVLMAEAMLPPVWEQPWIVPALALTTFSLVRLARTIVTSDRDLAGVRLYLGIAED
jgi:hypothetical protein